MSFSKHEKKPLLAYFISWTCYGQWLHGDRRGSVDEKHSLYGEEWLAPDAQRLAESREKMLQEPYSLHEPRRIVALEAIRGVSKHRNWTLHAVHVRANHVRVVVTAEALPDIVMKDFKMYASRALNEAGFESKDRIRWTKHGSTKYIFEEDYFKNAVNYVLNKQGVVMQRWPEAH